MFDVDISKRNEDMPVPEGKDLVSQIKKIKLIKNDYDLAQYYQKRD